ncbi:hypothetical protein NX801_06510 [Streptomyces sp. LP05-1]|uniref:Protein kinase domain-containing protein n=1 Tax=Streptomyces pyxinae TaxID=2970734 RepID=A0ABT2CFA5_9ACTN|nr:hypothetical protein [Streptomyces sp. LP05-1]MCS0635314.1 hypothetical protein [Streptomyces sp. LP05-1]
MPSTPHPQHPAEDLGRQARVAGAGGPPRAATLAFTLPSGHRRAAPVRFGPDSRRDPGLPQLVRNGMLDDEGRPCVQVRLAGAEAAHPRARALLDTEAGAVLRMHRTLAGGEYARLFPELIGHDLDADEPFLLYAPPRGVAVARTHVMSATDQRTFARDLLLALSFLAGQGLVARGVSPATVFWDGTSAQLWGLEAVERAGRARTRWGRPPYAAPEQRRAEGRVDARDAVWSAAQVLYQLATGRPGPADGVPADLAGHRALAERLGDAFAPRAADRPGPAALLERLAPEAARRLAVTGPAGPPDETAHHRAAFEQALRLKRETPRPPSGPEPGAEPGPGPAAGDQASRAGGDGPVLCPYCLEPIQLDLDALYVTNSLMQYEQLDLARHTNPLRRPDVMRRAVQRCAADPDFPEHHIPVPYLSYGRPLTVAMVGESTSGKSHLLTQMIAGIIEGGLKPFGLDSRPVNPEQHNRFIRDRVQPLRGGAVLGHTAAVGNSFARFVSSLLLTDARGRTRPVAFFDLAGEDLVRTDEVLRFLLGIDALLFVVDPVTALPLPELDHTRRRQRVEAHRGGDLAFGTVLDRLPRNGPYLEVASAMVLAKSDLLRFRPPVDRWLAEPPATSLDPARVRAESGDVYGLLRQYAGPAWLRPFDSIRRCTLHIASATGSQENRGRYPAGTGPRRVLEPLVSLLAMHGLIEVPGGGGADGSGPPGDRGASGHPGDPGATREFEEGEAR